MKNIILIYITNPNETAAEHIARYLLDLRLVACANIFPIQSIYWWQGDLCAEGEFVALVKTRPELWEEVKKTIEALHSYQVPCIIKIEVTANENYAQWIIEQTNTPTI